MRSRIAETLKMSMSNSGKYECVIIGAGITGLSAAFYLIDKFKTIALIDGGRIGGVIKTVSKDGYTLECGPNVIALKPEILNLLEKLGLSNEIIYPQTSKFQQMVYYKDKPVTVPQNPAAFLSTGLIGIKDKFKILRNLILPAKKFTEEDKSVDSFFTGLIGKEAVKNILDPVLSGIYGGDIASLSAKSLFPNVYENVRAGKPLFSAMRGRKRPKIGVLRAGMQSLYAAIWEKIKGRVSFFNEFVNGVEKEGDAFTIKLQSGKTLQTERVIVTTSGKATAKFMSKLSPDLSERLSSSQAASLVVVHASALVLPAEFHNSFGVLFPSTLKTPLLGVMFNSRLFPHLAPKGKELLTICFGGMHHPEFVKKPEKELTELAVKELKDKLKISQVEILNITYWENAIPQYNIGHAELISSLKRLESNTTGLIFCGADCGGIGVPDRVHCAKSAFMDIR
jgi:oxygen-dependent protoporphyrinogen oxidase